MYGKFVTSQTDSFSRADISIYLYGFLRDKFVLLVLIQLDLTDNVSYHPELAEIYHVVLEVLVTVLSMHDLSLVDSWTLVEGRDKWEHTLFSNNCCVDLKNNVNITSRF